MWRKLSEERKYTYHGYKGNKNWAEYRTLQSALDSGDSPVIIIDQNGRAAKRYIRNDYGTYGGKYKYSEEP